MYDHIGLKVRDLDRSVRFYSAVLAEFGYEVGFRDETTAGLGPKGAPALWLYAAGTKAVAEVHVAFAAEKRTIVDGFHKAGVKHGGRDNGLPGPRADYSPTYYAAFLIDPDGNNVEAVCLR